MANATITLQKPVVLDAIEAWPHWDQVIEGAVKEYGVTEAQAREALPEYQRFMALIASGTRHLSMFSVAVDKIWHSHILNSQLYFQFCDQLIGHYVHHVPILGRNRDCLTPEDTCSDKCDTGPDTCKTPAVENTLKVEAELPASTRFRQAYFQAFGETPGLIWNLPEADGTAI